MRRRGISLTEVLVVMMIVMVLVAVLMPALSSSKQAATRTSCVSNVRQLAMAVHMYHDSEGAWPVSYMQNPAFTKYVDFKPLCPAFPSVSPQGGYYISVAADEAPIVGDPTPNHSRWVNDCREKRGPAYPIVVDDNHVPNRRDLSKPTPVILARMDGSVHTVMWDHRTRSGPCHPDLDTLNL